MAAREFLMIVIESAYGTPKATPSAGTEKIYIRLDGGNAFTMVGDPQMYEVMYGGGRAIPAIMGSDQMQCTGQLTTKFYGSQAVFMTKWMATQVNAAQTSPWTTTEPPDDLASCSVYHAVMRSDGTYKRIRWAGTKVTNWKVDCSRDSKIATLTLGLQSQKFLGNTFDSSSDPDATEFPAPAESAYPVDPFRFIDLAGNFSIATSRTNFSAVSIAAQNATDPRWFESRFLMLHRFLGRRSTVDSTFLYKASPDDLATYQQMTVKALSLTFNNTVNTAVFQFNAANYFTKLTKVLPLDKVYELGWTMTNVWDPTAAAGAGADITVSGT